MTNHSIPIPSASSQSNKLVSEPAYTFDDVTICSICNRKIDEIAGNMKNRSDSDEAAGTSKNRNKFCFYCRNQGHKINQCHLKERDDNTRLIQNAINEGVHQNSEEKTWDEDAMVIGTDHGYWSEIWYVSRTYQHHFCNSVSMFRQLKRAFGVETRTPNNDILFIRGLGLVDLKLDDYLIQVPSVYYAPDVRQNILSFNQLRSQGYRVVYEGDKCRIEPMFKFLSTIHNYEDLVEERVTLIKEIDYLKDEETMKEYNDFKEEYLQNYFETLDEANQKNTIDWTKLILEAFKFYKLENCISFLDFIADEKVMTEYRTTIIMKFNEMIIWFLYDHLRLMEGKMIPPAIDDGEYVELFDLYAAVWKEDGSDVVEENELWSYIARGLGYHWSYSTRLKEVYDEYLRILELRYKRTKAAMMGEDGTRQTEKGETSTSTKQKDRKLSKQTGIFKRTGTDHSFYKGGDWNKAKMKKKKVNFEKAVAAVIEANKDVTKKKI